MIREGGHAFKACSIHHLQLFLDLFFAYMAINTLMYTFFVSNRRSQCGLSMDFSYDFLLNFAYMAIKTMFCMLFLSNRCSQRGLSIDFFIRIFCLILCICISHFPKNFSTYFPYICRLPKLTTANLAGE